MEINVMSVWLDMEINSLVIVFNALLIVNNVRDH